MKHIHALLILYLYFISYCNSLDEFEKQALNDISNEWNLNWEDTFECPGNRNNEKTFITCSEDGNVIELYLFLFGYMNFII